MHQIMILIESNPIEAKESLARKKTDPHGSRSHDRDLDSDRTSMKRSTILGVTGYGTSKHHCKTSW